jgi:hypothetical protein
MTRHNDNPAEPAGSETAHFIGTGPRAADPVHHPMTRHLKTMHFIEDGPRAADPVHHPMTRHLETVHFIGDRPRAADLVRRPMTRHNDNAAEPVGSRTVAR